MSRTFQIPIPDKGQSALVFPQRCACCGAPNQAESNLSITQQVMRGKKQAQVSIKYAIPHCTRCARSTQVVFLAGLIPFLLGLVLVGGVSAVAVWLIAAGAGLDNIGQPNNANSLVLAAFVGLIAGLLGGFVFELAARVVLLPFFGQALFQAPLLSAQMLSDADYVAGLSAKPREQATQLILTFNNDEIAREFAALNPTLAGN